MGASRVDTEPIRQQTRAFIVKQFKHELKDDDDIFALGFVNSLFAMQLVMFVEKTFNVAVEDDDLQIDNFRSVDAVVDLVSRKSA
jgi:acyl carrier protein